MNKKTAYDKIFLKFIPYFNGIGILTDTLISRIWYIYSICKELCPEEIIDIFIEDKLGKDKMTEYTCLNFFSKNYLISADNFITNVDLSGGVVTGKVALWRATAENYDFKKANEISQLVIEFSVLGEELESSLRATRVNCDYLLKFFRKYIIPNLTIPAKPKT